MPNTVRKEFSVNTGSGTVVPFRTSARGQSNLGSEAEFWRQVLREAVPEELIKSSIENAISQHFVQRLSAGDLDDNPFDAIYFAELQPDVVVSENIQLIKAFSSITDLSDTVEFDDDWED